MNEVFDSLKLLPSLFTSPSIPIEAVIACGNLCVMELKYKRDAEIAEGNDSIVGEGVVG